MSLKFELTHLKTDLLIIGGGTAGCYAAIVAKEASPEANVTIMEKAHIERSGCLAAGINAINAYLNPGETPESFLAYVRDDSAGLIRDDLVYSIALGLNRVTSRLEHFGLPILKDKYGRYMPRGKRSIRINGEGFKPILAKATVDSGTLVLNRVVATNYIISNGVVQGAFGFGLRDNKFYVVEAKTVICATGGASGLYRPNNGGSARHKMWYSPFNTGAGYAMGIRAGAEMTSFEMRFIALKVKDTMAPAGTLAQGVGAPYINALGERVLSRYGKNTTPMRLFANQSENRKGRGPCYLDTTQLNLQQSDSLKNAYLNMCPGMVLYWADRGIEPNSAPIEVTGSEPYVVGGHAQSGYWVGKDRRTTLKGLYAAGDVAGGAPKKYVSGCLVEGEIAALSALQYINEPGKLSLIAPQVIEEEMLRVSRPLQKTDGYLPEDLEERLQKIMDEYAGGISTGYELCESKLKIARELLRELKKETSNLQAGDLHQLMLTHEVIDRVDVARVLVEHLLYRRETRWPCYQSRIDYPEKNDKRWLKFVNSVYEQDKDLIRIMERPLVKTGDFGEH